jgi:hypothetical protein
MGIGGSDSDVFSEGVDLPVPVTIASMIASLGTSRHSLEGFLFIILGWLQLVTVGVMF